MTKRDKYQTRNKAKTQNIKPKQPTSFYKIKYTTNNKTHNTSKAYHSQLGSRNLKFLLKIDHLHNHNPKYPQLSPRRKEK